MAVQSARGGIAWLHDAQEPCPNATEFAGSWKLNALPVPYVSDRASPSSYELDVTIERYADGEQPWVRVRGPSPRSPGTFEGIATWSRNCNWIGVDSMTLRNATGEHVDVVFLLSLAAGELRGLLAIYEDPRDAEYPNQFAFWGGAAAGRERPPKFTTDLEGFPCELSCGLRYTPLDAMPLGIGWADSNGYLMCEEEECADERTDD
jgi:hypothetical protein